ncbi:MAG: hypothetical protein AAB681_01390 [Patescibacteria group bacterium]
MLAFTKKEIALMKKLNTPEKVQDFLNRIPINKEKNGVGTAKSPVMVLREKNAHCIEGAMLGAYILSLHGHKPLLMHLETIKSDFEHVIAPFKVGGLWGALSKTNHAVLRFRDPVYKNIRELAMSYFHEYTDDNGFKTLRKYSDLLDLREFKDDWMFEENDLWGVDEELGKIKHYNIVPKGVKLRRADPIEQRVGKVVEW